MNERLSPFSELTEAIEARRKKVLVRRQRSALLWTMLRTLLAVALFYAMFQWKFSFKIVNGNGMYPALTDGDMAVTYRQEQYVKNDVVFYEVDGKEYVGRVVAKGGDTVDYSENGDLVVNGTPQVVGIVYPTQAPEGWEGALQIPDGCVYILGDYRIETVDSRDFGMVPLENVDSRILVLIRHRGI